MTEEEYGDSRVKELRDATYREACPRFLATERSYGFEIAFAGCKADGSQRRERWIDVRGESADELGLWS